jgi:hypothetical protein
VQFLADPEVELARILPASSRRGKRCAVFLEDPDPFFGDLAQFRVNRLLVITMNTAEDKAGKAADKALVFLRPFDNL